MKAPDECGWNEALVEAFQPADFCLCSFIQVLDGGWQHRETRAIGEDVGQSRGFGIIRRQRRREERLPKESSQLRRGDRCSSRLTRLWIAERLLPVRQVRERKIDIPIRQKVMGHGRGLLPIRGRVSQQGKPDTISSIVCQEDKALETDDLLDEKVHQARVVPQRIGVSLEWFVRETIPREIKQTDIMIRRQIGSKQMKIITTGWKPMQENNGRGRGIAQAPIVDLERISTSSLGIPSKILARRLLGVSTINHRTIPFFRDRSGRTRVEQDSEEPTSALEAGCTENPCRVRVGGRVVDTSGGEPIWRGPGRSPGTLTPRKTAAQLSDR
jgi:hypothetical protein